MINPWNAHGRVSHSLWTQHECQCSQFAGERAFGVERLAKSIWGGGRGGGRRKKRKEEEKAEGEKKFERRRDLSQWPARLKGSARRLNLGPQTVLKCAYVWILLPPGSRWTARLLLCVAAGIRWVWLHDEERPCSVHFQQGWVAQSGLPPPAWPRITAPQVYTESKMLRLG